jgi:hypothetical protein
MSQGVAEDSDEWAVMPLQGGGHWFESSSAHDAELRSVSGFLPLLDPQRDRCSRQGVTVRRVACVLTGPIGSLSAG